MEISQIREWLGIGQDGMMFPFHTYYPLTIVSQRYGYWPGKYQAFPLDISDFNFEDLNGGDMEAYDFREAWDEEDIPVGFGASPQGALDDLIKKMKDKYRAFLKED